MERGTTWVQIMCQIIQEHLHLTQPDCPLLDAGLATVASIITEEQLEILFLPIRTRGMLTILETLVLEKRYILKLLHKPSLHSKEEVAP